MEFTKSEAKEWARKNLRGLEAVIFPSFTPDLQELDEEGIRYDVQHLADNGFMSLLCASEVCGMTFEERKKFIEIVCDEAKGKIHTSITVLHDTIEQDIEMLQHYENTGGSVAMVGHPLQYYPRSVEEIYRMYKFMCDSTNLAITFYPARLKTKSLHQSYWPMSLLPRIADIPNVVALKIGGGSSLAFTAQCFHLVGDRLLVNDPIPERWMLTVPKCGQQWSGASPFYMFQTPENPRMVRMFDLLVEGEIDKALDIYWEMEPINEASMGMASVSYFDTGIIYATMDKYYHWCNGGNGGMLRQPVPRLHDYHKERIRTSLIAGGMTPREAPEEEFYVGRTNYARGARLREY
jgi:4-hydroxy-tetrahydrodipicolinate synthase